MDRNYARNYLPALWSVPDNCFNLEFGFCEEIKSNTRNLGWQVKFVLGLYIIRLYLTGIAPEFTLWVYETWCATVPIQCSIMSG